MQTARAGRSDDEPAEHEGAEPERIGADLGERRILAGLAAICANYRSRISELAGLRALRLRTRPPRRQPGRLPAPGRGTALPALGRPPGPPAGPARCRSRGATLDGGEFTDCDLSDARLDGADLSRSVLDRCRLDRVQAAGVDLTGATVHECSAMEIRLDAPRLHHTHWLGQLPPILSEEVQNARAEIADRLADSPAWHRRWKRCSPRSGAGTPTGQRRAAGRRRACTAAGGLPYVPEQALDDGFVPSRPASQR
ncbi:pentapeptide repeat-containing protein [Thiohalocapsa sp. ML1]|uniref:pentapeptide repeat-containing protein n=1 Tax=Thiohalocapsa sp. ML1 TaxID=1431688 RepID=UPI0009EB14DC